MHITLSCVAPVKGYLCVNVCILKVNPLARAVFTVFKGGGKGQVPWAQYLLGVPRLLLLELAVVNYQGCSGP